MGAPDRPARAGRGVAWALVLVLAGAIALGAIGPAPAPVPASTPDEALAASGGGDAPGARAPTRPDPVAPPGDDPSPRATGAQADGRPTAADGIAPDRTDRYDTLDDAPAAVVAERLGDAIERARSERGVRIADGLVEQVIADGSVPIIVAQPRARIALEPRLAGTRHAPAHYYRHIPYAAIEVGPQALLDLVESLDVLAIEADRAHRPSLIDSVPLVSADAATAAGYDGTGRVIALIDTGVDTGHPVFAGRLVDEACFSRDGDCPGGGTREMGPGSGAPCPFGCGHGTLVAGVALGLDPNGLRTGVAPDAGLISIQVFSNDGGEPSAYASDIIAGLEHVYDLRTFHPIAAVNMSLGGDTPYDSTEGCDADNGARKAVIDLLRRAGIPSIASSGNEGLTGQMDAPACISTVVSVGSTTKIDTVSGFSNAAPFLSLLAPGSAIQTARQGGGFATSSGTSLAAPHVAGAWAAITEAVPGSNVAEVLFALQSTGEPIDDDRNGLTFPRIDVAAAITALDAGIEIEDPVGPGEGAAEIVPQPALPSSACGLVGIEAVLAVLLVRALPRRRVVRG
jgi:hypothetical protein